MGSLLSASAAFGDYLSGLLQALAALGVVAAFAFVALRFGALRTSLRPRDQRLSVEDRLRLDARSQLMIVRIEQRRLLIATHTEGPARLLAELGDPPPEAARLPELAQRPLSTSASHTGARESFERAAAEPLGAQPGVPLASPPRPEPEPSP